MVGFAMRAKAAYIYVRGEFWVEANNLQRSVDEVKNSLCRLMQRDFWGKMPVDQVMTSMFMYTLEQEPIYVEKKLA